jgi:heme-degrading monooxygenase HmoA
MNVYITTGTYEYLKGMAKEHPQENMLLMENENGALLLHQTEGETVFKEPRKYEVLDGAGNLGVTGFVVMNNIPVTDEGRPIFEYRFKNRSKQIENQPGFSAIRVLRPLSSNTYIVLTVWENEASFKNWKNSESFKGAHSHKPEESGIDPQTKIFASSSYTTIYTISE